MKRTLSLILRNYNKTLENLHLHLRNNKEMLDDLILRIFTQCPRLNQFYFDGIIEDFQLLRDVCQIKNQGASCKI